MSIRTERVAALVQREIADLLNTEYAEQVQPLVTVTDARITPDLSIAYVYLSVYGDTHVQRSDALEHLRTLAADLRQSLAGRVRHQLRTVPEIKLFLDESLQHAQHMEDLFDRIRDERKHRGAE